MWRICCPKLAIFIHMKYYIYFRLKPLDIEFMKRLHEKVNIIPLIAKADTLTPEECQQFKKQVSRMSNSWISPAIHVIRSFTCFWYNVLKSISLAALLYCHLYYIKYNWKKFFLGSTSVWTQDFALARQALYHLSHASNLLSLPPLFWK
jgi:hypothetical protein